jgi:hypothetical protein
MCNIINKMYTVIKVTESGTPETLFASSEFADANKYINSFIISNVRKFNPDVTDPIECSINSPADVTSKGFYFIKSFSETGKNKGFPFYQIFIKSAVETSGWIYTYDIDVLETFSVHLCRAHTSKIVEETRMVTDELLEKLRNLKTNRDPEKYADLDKPKNVDYEISDLHKELLLKVGTGLGYDEDNEDAFDPELELIE